jgi:hypothetical protein
VHHAWHCLHVMRTPSGREMRRHRFAAFRVRVGGGCVCLRGGGTGGCAVTPNRPLTPGEAATQASTLDNQATGFRDGGAVGRRSATRCGGRREPVPSRLWIDTNTSSPVSRPVWRRRWCLQRPQGPAAWRRLAHRWGTGVPASHSRRQKHSCSFRMPPPAETPQHSVHVYRHQDNLASPLTPVA